MYVLVTCRVLGRESGRFERAGPILIFGGVDFAAFSRTRRPINTDHDLLHLIASSDGAPTTSASHNALRVDRSPAAALSHVQTSGSLTDGIHRGSRAGAWGSAFVAGPRGRVESVAALSMAGRFSLVWDSYQDA